MAIESADDLAAFFDPRDFGEEMIAHLAAGDLPFDGIATSSAVAEKPGSTAAISMKVPRILAYQTAVPDLKQSDEITIVKSGARVIVNDIEYKGALIIIHYHELW